MEKIEITLARETGLCAESVGKVIDLLDEGNTVPFIARYRKEATGGMDDTTLREFAERLTSLRNLQKRREEVCARIAEIGALTPALQEAIENAATVTAIEDLYRPFRPKKRTRASVARERGLSALANAILAQKKQYVPTLVQMADAKINPSMDLPDREAVFVGVCDILAEEIADRADCREVLREWTRRTGVLESEKKKEKAEIPAASSAVYAQYFSYQEPIRTLPGHRVLALNRGEREDVLRVRIRVDKEAAYRILLEKIGFDSTRPSHIYIERAVQDGYDRLLAPAVEREIRGALTAEASEAAIRVFSMNLRALLLQPPLVGKTVLGFDPGYRNGCKLAVVRPDGGVLHTTVIYPTKPREDVAGARKTLLSMIQRYGVEVVALGNGTASGESEQFLADTLRDAPGVRYTVVSEAGASVYSASALAAAEFPAMDVTERSAVSIARRLEDPLAELVKIDPAAIGVGQYQHDMPPARLEEALAGVVESCVNAVGVNLNTASPALLSYIAGINRTTAAGIVRFREENGPFARRQDVLAVPRLGKKAYEQAAGFLRVPDSAEPLDNTGVHPESYVLTKRLLAALAYAENALQNGGLSDVRARAEKAGLPMLCDTLGCGMPTLCDILAELEKPGRDIRDTMPQPVLRDRVLRMEDLQAGDIFTGTVRNVVDFGAFVDIGVHRDGLVHISEITERYIRHPSEVLHVGDTVRVAVQSVDTARGRISFTMKGLPEE